MGEASIESAGRVLGRYQVCSDLASGGMASVHLASARGPGGFEKVVALKCIHPHLAEQRAFVEMFLDEARIVGQITHANVCQVFDFGEHGGRYYIAMEYVLGETLHAVMNAIAESPRWRDDAVELPAFVARIVADACEGVHAAHELRGADGSLLHVVHRDLSPQNLFLTYDGVVKVVDFGVLSARERLHTTSTGHVKGKFPYMAPEQLRVEKVDRRADVWSLGVVLWEMLAQRRLFRRRTDAATIGALLQDPIPAPSAVRPGLPKALDAIVLRALSRDPDGRYETARAFGAALLEHTGQPPVGLGDLARWMALLFPGERQNKEALVSRARAFVPAVPHKRGKRGLSRGLRRGLVVITIAGAAGVAGAVGLAAGMRTAARPPDQRAAPRVEAEASAMPSIAAEPRVDAVQITRTEMPAPSTRSPAHAAAARSERGRRAPRHAIAGGTGQVNISTPGCWALVFVDGRARGQTPTQITLGAGHQSIELRPFGRARGRRFAVDIEPGELARLRVPVARLR